MEWTTLQNFLAWVQRTEQIFREEGFISNGPSISHGQKPFEMIYLLDFSAAPLKAAYNYNLSLHK